MIYKILGEGFKKLIITAFCTTMATEVAIRIVEKVFDDESEDEGEHHKKKKKHDKSKNRNI